MKLNNLHLAWITLALIVFQFIINNLTIFYVDLVAILLVSILLLGSYTWTQLIVLSLVADLIGHWYLGSHLLAITLLSLMSGSFVNFYRMCNWLQRTMIASAFFLLLMLIIYLLELLTAKKISSPWSLLIEVFILIPLVQLLLNNLLSSYASGFMYND